MHTPRFCFTLVSIICLILVIPGTLMAAANFSNLINKAGMQRMLSQRIAKAYFYKGNNIRTQLTAPQLESAKKTFQRNHAELKSKIKDPAILEVLSFVEFAYTEFAELVSQPYDRENAALVLDLSETLLETSHDVVLKLEKLSGSKSDRIVNISGKQRMLSQRISKYYIAYRSGFKDINSVHQLERAVQEFEDALRLLQSEKRNTEQINQLLTKTEKQWSIVKKFFLTIRKGGIPVMVFLTTDRITELMNEVTYLYVDISPTGET